MENFKYRDLVFFKNTKRFLERIEMFDMDKDEKIKQIENTKAFSVSKHKCVVFDDRYAASNYISNVGSIDRYFIFRFHNISEVISYFTQSEELHFTEQIDFKDVKTFSNNVKKLVLYKCTSESLRDISTFTSLTHLVLSNNQLTDIYHIKFLLYSLEFLDISNNLVSDIKPLLSFNSLVELNISCNNIIDIKPLSSINTMKVLDVSGNRIKDISPLANNVLLIDLDLSSNTILDCKPIKGLVNLIRLDISHNSVSNLYFLSEMTNMKIFLASFNPILIYNSISLLTNLIVVDLSYTSINYIKPLLYISSLIYLNLCETRINSFEDLSYLYNIVYLSITITSANKNTFNTNGLSRLKFLHVNNK